MVHATYLNTLRRAQNWYTQGKECAILWIQHVITANLEFHKPSDQVQFMLACNRTEASRKGAM